MTILLISNKYCYHCEIIESLILKHKEIIGVNADKIYLDLLKDLRWASQFKNYILEKYPDIILGIPSKFDYSINVTLPKNAKIKESNINFYIGHNHNSNHVKLKNVFWTSPFYKKYVKTNILPLTDKMVQHKDYPIYIIQGNKDPKRRNFKLLDNILNGTYNHKFLIRWNGSGILPEKYNVYKQNGLIEETRGNFLDFHKHFLNCYCILPLITKKSHPIYYKNKLTSTMNYADAYKFKCLIDKELQNIYKLPDVEIYNDENDIVDAFKKTLEDFYKKKLN